MLCYEIVTTTGTSNSFIKSRAQHRQAGAIPFYSCCLWISVDRGAVNTSSEVSINKLRLTSFIEMVLYCMCGAATCDLNHIMTSCTHFGEIPSKDDIAEMEGRAVRWMSAVADTT